MPNHVTTILTATNPDALAVLVHTLTAEEQFEAHKKEREGWPGMREKTLSDFEDRKIVDFEQIVPSPPNKETGGCSGKHDEDVVCWYEWNTQNWGTKWNAYEAVIDDRTTRLEFDTAWSHPFPVIETLSRMFPNEPIHVQYADEDLGSNLGEYTILNGEEIDDSTPEDEDARNDFAAMVKYGMTYAMLQAEWETEDA